MDDGWDVVRFAGLVSFESGGGLSQLDPVTQFLREVLVDWELGLLYFFFFFFFFSFFEKVAVLSTVCVVGRGVLCAVISMSNNENRVNWALLLGRDLGSRRRKNDYLLFRLS
jgi:hypothetical protein